MGFDAKLLHICINVKLFSFNFKSQFFFKEMTIKCFVHKKLTKLKKGRHAKKHNDLMH